MTGSAPGRRASRPWTPEELELLGTAVELEIAVPRPDGAPGRWTPIRVVRADGAVYVRTWYRRTSGWFGAACRAGRGHIRVPGLDTEVTIDDVADEGADLRAVVDGAYGAKYGSHGAASMVTAAAADTTLRLSPVR